MSENHRIYVDFDDVLSESARALTKVLQQHYAKTVAFDDITSFDLSVSFGLTAREYAHFMHLAHDPNLLSALEPIGGAVDALNELVSMGYEIAIITGRPAETTAR